LIKGDQGGFKEIIIYGQVLTILLSSHNKF